MQQRTINFLKMTSGVIAGLQNEKSAWESEEEIAGVITDLITNYNSIEGVNLGILSTNTTGYTDEKDNLFDSITNRTLKLCNKMSAYAKLKSDHTLLPLVDMSLSALSRGIEKEAVARCGAIADKAGNMLTQLASFKVSEEEINTIKQQVKAYNASLDGRTTVSGNLTVSGSEISSRISILRQKLDILDNLIEGLIEDDAFVARYKSWRKITDYGKGKTLTNNKSAAISSVDGVK